jgi:hypothetical protein
MTDNRLPPNDAPTPHSALPPKPSRVRKALITGALGVSAVAATGFLVASQISCMGVPVAQRLTGEPVQAESLPETCEVTSRPVALEGDVAYSQLVIEEKAAPATQPAQYEVTSQPIPMRGIIMPSQLEVEEVSPGGEDK